MLKVRLARRGAKKDPFYHIVVTDSENPRDGRYLEQIGRYDPSKPMGEAKIDHERLQHWVSHGAQLNDRVAKVAREVKKAAAAATAAS